MTDYSSGITALIPAESDHDANPGGLLMTDYSAGITAPGSAGIRVLAIVNDAGSAGKTTTTVSLAALLAQGGRRVLVVDLDSQANATRWLGVDPDQVVLTSGDVLLRQATLAEATLPTNTAGVQLVPASDALKHQRVELGRATGGEQRLRQALVGADVDVVLIDCQAGAGELYPVTAMVAATGVLTVTLPGPKELEGLPRVEDMVREVADAYNPNLRLVGVVPCAVPAPNRGRLYSDAVVMLREAYDGLVTPSVRHSVAAVAAYDHRLPLPVDAPTADVTQDYRAVLAHLVGAGVVA